MKTNLFQESPELDGYAIAVRNDWSYKLEREFVTKEERDAYLEKFGETIMTREQFFDWWCQYHQCG